VALYFKEETSLGDETATMEWNCGNEIPSDAVYFSQENGYLKFNSLCYKRTFKRGPVIVTLL